MFEDLFETPSHRIVFRTLRHEFGDIPNVDLEPVKLGDVGTFDARRCKFSWPTNLSQLGIQATPTSPAQTKPKLARVEKLFVKGKSTEFQFEVTAGQPAKAKFDFGEKNSLSMQAIGLQLERYDVEKLRLAIEDWIANGGIWNRDWVVVTEVTTTASFTILFSRSSNAKAHVSTQLPYSLPTFNLANTSLGLDLSYYRGEVLNSIAKDHVQPFFQIHKLKGWRIVRDHTGILAEERKRLEPYG